jgi:hypothetical protein
MTGYGTDVLTLSLLIGRDTRLRLRRTRDPFRQGTRSQSVMATIREVRCVVCLFCDTVSTAKFSSAQLPISSF